jgi:hypothetical protein
MAKKDEKKEEEMEKEDDNCSEKAISEDTLMKSIERLENVATTLTEAGKGAEEEKPFAKAAAESSEEIKKGMEISSFLSDLVGEVSDTIGSMSDRFEKSFTLMTGAVKESTDIIKGLTSELQKANERIEALEKSPVTGRKGVTNLTKGISRFEDGEEQKPLGKEAITKGLEVLIKSGKAVPFDMIRFETTGQLSKSVFDDLKKMGGE